MAFVAILRQSTAVNVIIGPFVDSTDGDTEETGLTIAQADVRLSKNAGADAQKNDATTCAHEGDGFYMCEFDATDTNTVGMLTLWVHVAGALACRHDFQIVEEAVYDISYAAAATGAVPVASIANNAITAASIAADAITDAKVASDVTIASVTGAVGSVTGSVGSVTGAVGSVTGAVGSVTGNVGGNVTGSVGSVAAGGITASSIATNAIDADALATDAVTEIRNGLGLAAANLDTQLDALPTATEIADAILNRDFASVSDTNARTLLNAARFLRNKWSIAGGTLTVTEEDDTTTAWTSALTGTPGADPVTASDPA